MRHQRGSLLKNRAALVAACIVIVALVAMPAIALAATPHSTLATTRMYFSKAQAFTISGNIAKSTAGKYITVEIRKPGRTFWTPVASAKISTLGKWSTKYTPKLAGWFYIRARYGTTDAGLSRTARVKVAKGPGKTILLTIASTTSTRDSGLWDALKPTFLAQCPEYAVKATFVGSGAAINLGYSGNADVLLTHDAAAEASFMTSTTALHHGTSRYKVMYNWFYLVGPKANPSNITTAEAPSSAFGKIASNALPFYSRNDNSGTNAREKLIWASIGNPQGTPGSYASWYKASGVMGMGEALAAANNGSPTGYTLTDCATWFNMSNANVVKNLRILNQGHEEYKNQYAVMTVSGVSNWEGARDFSLWLQTPTAQKIINNYGLETFGPLLAPGTQPFVANPGPYPWN